MATLESRPHETRPPQAGFGLLRVDPTSAKQGKAISAALRAGVEVYDLGSLSEPANEEKAKWLLSEIARTAPTQPIHFLIRGKIGRSDALARFLSLFSPGNPGIRWTYFVEGDHGVSYEEFRKELSVLRDFEKCHPEISLSLGVSSTRFTYEKEDPEFLSLEGLLASGKTFSALEFPLNLYESAAFLATNQAHGDETLSLLDAAARNGLKTYTRRPFDSLTDSQLLRLVSYPDHHRLDLDETVKRTLKLALQAEEILVGTAHPKWAHRLHSQLQFVSDPEQWKEITTRRLRPELDTIRAEGDHFTHYLDCMEALLLSVQLWCEKRAAERNERIRTQIATSSPELKGASRDLAELALTIYRSMPGLTTLLIGMRTEDYVASVMSTLQSDQALLSRDAISLALSAAHCAIHEAISETGTSE